MRSRRLQPPASPCSYWATTSNCWNSSLLPQALLEIPASFVSGRLQAFVRGFCTCKARRPCQVADFGTDQLLAKTAMLPPQAPRQRTESAPAASPFLCCRSAVQSRGPMDPPLRETWPASLGGEPCWAKCTHEPLRVGGSCGPWQASQSNEVEQSCQSSSICTTAGLGHEEAMLAGH